jgi:ADP-heptose:LPS heptosyltransferase
MHILENYALITGCKINKCFIDEEHIELPTNKYITFHPFSPKGSSRQYNKWHIVINSLKQNQNFKYDIIQVGENNDTKYNNVNTEYLGKTNYHSLAFLIKNSSLHLGYDSLPIHFASHYDIPIVAIYPWYSKNCGPYFSSNNKIKIFEPDFSIIKPTYSMEDPNNLINTISPDKIYNAIKDLLEIK